MKCFLVLSCVLAVACGLNRYPIGGGFGSSNYGYSSQEQQSHHESHQSASSSHVSSAGGLVGGSSGLIGGGLADTYGLGGINSGVYDAHSLTANSLAARSSIAAAESGLNTGYGSDFGSIHDAATLAGSGVGIGGSSLGGFNSFNGGQSFSRQSSMSRSSFSQSSSFSHSHIDYEHQWPELYQVPLFQSLCGLKSTLKSQEFASTFAHNSYNYGEIFSDLYSKNTLLQKYFYTATGIRYQDSYRNNYIQLINDQPYQALRLATIFARNPNIFTSNFGQFIIGGSSLELLQNYQTSSTRYSYDAFYSSRFLSSLVRSKYYSRSLAYVFGIQQNLSYDLLQQQLLNRISGYYRSNAAGTLLLLRHVLARRQISSLDGYLGCTGVDVYSSQLNNYWAQKAWRHNSYYSNWSRQFARSSSFSSTSSRSSRVMSRSLSTGSLGYNGIGI